jgi:membrane fusion protein, multidrug efflux system
MSNKLFALLLLIATLNWLCYCHRATPNKKTAGRQSGVVSSFEGVIAKPKVIDRTISISGSLRAFEETVLTPEVAGRVVFLNLPEGKFVKMGTLLVKLFDSDLQAQIQRSQAQLLIAEQTKKRQSELIKINGISQLDYDQTVLQVNSIKADIEVLKVQIRRTEVLAPFDGMIGLRNISMGAQVSSGTPLATIRSVNQLKLDFSVPEKYTQDVKTGKKISFHVQGDEKAHDATVIATEEGIDASTRNLKVRAVVNNQGVLLTPGTFANVELKLGENKNSIMIPTQAVIPQERNKQVIVAKHGKARFVSVETGVRQASNIEVLDSIAAGDTVVTTGILFIKPGMKLKFSKVIKE